MSTSALPRIQETAANRWWVRGLSLAVLVAVGMQATIDMKVVVFALMGVLYLMGCARYPELNLILYYIAGKLGFEERLELAWGISANQVLQILFAISFLLSLRSIRANSAFPRVTVGFLALWTAVMSISLLYSRNPEYGSYKVLGYVFLVLPGVIWMGARTHSQQLVHRFTFFFLCVSIGMMLMGLKNIGSLEPGHRLAVLGGGANVYSRMVGSGLLLLISMALVWARSGHRWVAWGAGLLLTPGFLVTMYYAGSKGPMVSMFLCFLGFALLNGFLRKTMLVVAIIAIGFTLARNQSQAIDDTVELVSASRLFLNPTDEVSYGSYGSRMEFYSYSFGLVAGSPLFGVGTGAWGMKRRVVEERSYPHNIFMETMTEYGILMTLVLSAYLAWLVFRALWLVRQPMPPARRALLTGLVTCLAFWLLNVQVSGDIIDNRNLWLFAVLVEISAHLQVRQGNGVRS